MSPFGYLPVKEFKMLVEFARILLLCLLEMIPKTASSILKIVLAKEILNMKQNFKVWIPENYFYLKY
ncbi:hypothetical protein BpHYR1_031913 [Brachionus plicatilis]|uniref:Uncharacterized protein n=1 Tax=Brachionus plicatilis TaxID=10195 RepID=A0A3M7R9T0_BRAPC|nr:hypothetical protein BpHYR1_031913 [Brachionus plicatilis]